MEFFPGPCGHFWSMKSNLTVEILERKTSSHWRIWLESHESKQYCALQTSCTCCWNPLEVVVTPRWQNWGQGWQEVECKGGSSTSGVQIAPQQCYGSWGRTGLPYFPTSHVKTSKGKESCQLVLEDVAAAMEEDRACRMVEMRLLGAWLKWKNGEEKSGVGWTRESLSLTGRLCLLSSLCMMCLLGHQTCMCVVRRTHQHVLRDSSMVFLECIRNLVDIDASMTRSWEAWLFLHEGRVLKNHPDIHQLCQGLKEAQNCH